MICRAAARAGRPRPMRVAEAGPVQSPQPNRWSHGSPIARVPSSIDLSSRTMRYLAGRLTPWRQGIGTRWRRLMPGRQALLVVAHLWWGDTCVQLAAGFRIGIATGFRYMREAVDVLAALALSLAETMKTDPDEGVRDP